MVKMTTAGTKQIIKTQHNGNVSADAIETVKEETLAFAETLSAKASEYANHAGRSTVQEADVKLAIKNI